ncbi:Eco57I restriction-modification methylase domain-containing protein [Shinella pollutisoli]|uniref:site-specific DNA-methyltransferase (adenine-specific) n=1 Tax=Shinella pollutisoli TaxID=2250594 RepID=A0ABV7DN96_9HYPH|nr:DNA methyltransferase [Shinella pollutisoli]
MAITFKRMASKAYSFRAEQGWRPFHWEIEFPEVFSRENPGFDAIIGNPPFAGKNTISAASGPRYLSWLQQVHTGAHGNADLVAHFFRRAFHLVREGGAFGLIATNTIGQGDTRATGLATILSHRGNIFRATKRYQWPNEGAAVVVSIVHVGKGVKARSPVLDGRQVDRISAYLVAGDFDDAPTRLIGNAGKAFQGSILLGVGFTFDDLAANKGEAESLDKMLSLIENDPTNQQRIFPLIGGEEITTSPVHEHHRYAIDFFDRPLRRNASFQSWSSWSDERRTKALREGVVPVDYPGEVAEDWPDLIEIVRRRVKPIRDPQARDALRDRWWQYAEKRPGLYRRISGLPRVLANSSKATPHHAFAFLPSGMIYSQNLNVFAFEASAAFCVMQSRLHELWARYFGTTLEDRLTYVKDDCFETFPFSEGYESDETLEQIGQAYHDHRAALMIEADEGMTKTYNRFHKESECGAAIAHLRELHDEMDRAVLHAYGWDDLAEEVQPQFLTEETEDDHTYQGRYFWPAEQRDKVLSRLLALNAERHAEEVRQGIAPKGSPRGGEADDENTDDDGAGLFG